MGLIILEQNICQKIRKRFCSTR